MRSDNELLGAMYDSRMHKIEQLEDEIVRLKARIAEFEGDTRHQIELREDGWTIMHPMICRPDLFVCEFNALARDTPELGQLPNGRYYCTVDGYKRLVIQEEVTSEDDRPEGASPR